MGLLAQDERNTVTSIEVKTRELKAKLDALGVYEQARLFVVILCLRWLTH